MDNAQIEILKQDSKCSKSPCGRRARHRVTLSHDDYQRLAGGKVTPEKLIEKSFEFLLERESNTSILSCFDLPVIARYFPEYEKTIIKRL